MRKMLKRMLAPVFYVTANREQGLSHEIKFWQKWIQTKGWQWPEDFARRLDPGSVVTGYHRQVIERIAADTIHILDVGAGPLTAIGKVYENRKLILQACDPLADEYNKVLLEHSLRAPVVTEKCDGEALSSKYPGEHFDWVNAQNCVDHSYDPVKVIREMIHVAKRGGVISLCHELNAAKHEAYRGLHQWNFYQADGDLMLSGKYGYRKNLTEELKDDVQFVTWVDDNQWIYAIGTKLAP
jgi:SAM-dependent methyltransferase